MFRKSYLDSFEALSKPESAIIDSIIENLKTNKSHELKIFAATYKFEYHQVSGEIHVEKDRSLYCMIKQYDETVIEAEKKDDAEELRQTGEPLSTDQTREPLSTDQTGTLLTKDKISELSKTVRCIVINSKIDTEALDIYNELVYAIRKNPRWETNTYTSSLEYTKKKIPSLHHTGRGDAVYYMYNFNKLTFQKFTAAGGGPVLPIKIVYNE